MSDAPPLLVDLEREMRRHMLAALPADDTGSLHENDFRAVHTIYASWRARVPTTVPRRVHLSAELLANPQRGAYALGLEAILRELALGAIQEWMGHRNYATTEIYADYAPDPSQGAAFAQRAFGTITEPPGAPSASIGSRR